MFKQQINALQLILDNVKLQINSDIPDDNLIKQNEEEDLIETLSGIIYDLIISDPSQYTNPKFHEKIVDEVEEVAIEQLKHLYITHFKSIDKILNTESYINSFEFLETLVFDNGINKNMLRLKLQYLNQNYYYVKQ
jgi:hypothetical protein